MLRRKSLVAGGFTAVAASLAMMSFAYACTQFEGTFRAQRAGSATVARPAGEWVQGTASCGGTPMTNTISRSAVNELSASGGTLTPADKLNLTTGNLTGCPTGQLAGLPDGTYEVGMQNPGYQSGGCCEGFPQSTSGSGNAACSLDNRQLDKVSVPSLSPIPPNPGPGSAMVGTAVVVNVLGTVHITGGLIDTSTPLGGTANSAAPWQFAMPPTAPDVAGTQAALCLSDFGSPANGQSIPIQII